MDTLRIQSNLPSPTVVETGEQRAPFRFDPIEEKSSVGFDGIFKNAVMDANQAERVAASQMEALAAGTSDDLHGTMITLKEAEISLKLVGTIRNKLLDAFHELWRTNV